MSFPHLSDEDDTSFDPPTLASLAAAIEDIHAAAVGLTRTVGALGARVHTLETHIALLTRSTT